MLEMSFSVVEWAWNSVNVRGDDGLLHSGRVIDAVDGGLVVHFGGTGQCGPKLIPVGNVYYRSANSYTYDDTWINKGPTVEVLLRLQPEAPWKWYPGLLLDTFGLVRVTLPDRELKGFVMGQRIKERSMGELAMAYWRVKNDDFSRKLVVVPSELSASLESDCQLVVKFNAYCRENRYRRMAIEVRNNPRHGVLKELVILEMTNQLDRAGSGHYRMLQPLDKMLLSLFKSGVDFLKSVGFLSPATSFPDGDIQSLCRDPSIFPLILECFTTVEQSKLRGVCRQWEGMLTSVYIRRVLKVLSPSFVGDYTNDADLFASCLYNCWTSHTRVLVLHGSPFYHIARLADIDRPLQRILAEKGLPPVEVLLLTGDWFFLAYASNEVNALHDLFASLAAVCQQVILMNVRIYLKLGHSGVIFGAFSVRFRNNRITRQVTVNNFWTMLNNELHDLSATDMERLEEWIKKSNTTEADQIAQILNATQTLDPRDGVHYRGMLFAPDGDAGLDCVDVRLLTKLTLHALLWCLDKNIQKNLVCKFPW